MRKTRVYVLLLSLAILPAGNIHSERPQTQQGGTKTDAAGNIYVRSESGEWVKMAEAGHCVMVLGTVSDQMIACAVWDRSSANAEERLWSRRLEIYRVGGKVTVIDTGEVIGEWHLCNDGQQVAVVWDSQDAQRVHVLYESETGRVLERVVQTSDARLLPQWAKDRGQLDDESVEDSPTLTLERTKWIARTLRQIQTIRPGMTRSDLLKVFTEEGGMSNRFGRRYVYQGCAYIKVDVRFKSPRSHDDGWEEEPGDVIVSISKPYLEWSIKD